MKDLADMIETYIDRYIDIEIEIYIDRYIDLEIEIWI